MVCSLAPSITRASRASSALRKMSVTAVRISAIPSVVLMIPPLALEDDPRCASSSSDNSAAGTLP